MDSIGNVGALLPLWIVGAPFVAGLIALFTRPKGARTDRRESPVAPRPLPVYPGTARGPQAVAGSRF